MADHYVALNQGITGEKYVDFLTGTATTAGTNQIELRVQDGTTMTRKDIELAILAFHRFFQNPQQVSTAGFQLAL
jgi:hypothetical protein